MSLKTFHIVFIALSTALTLGLGLWILFTPGTDGPQPKILALLAFAAGGGLILYGVRFLRKLKHVGFL